MNTNNLVNEIIKLPQRFYSIGNISIYSLLKETGYFEKYNLITNANILEGLIEQPEYLNYWLEWSDNKRNDSGWYFKKKFDKYLVGCLLSDGQIKETEYSNGFIAGANFIKLEIETIRMS